MEPGLFIVLFPLDVDQGWGRREEVALPGIVKELGVFREAEGFCPRGAEYMSGREIQEGRLLRQVGSRL